MLNFRGKEVYLDEIAPAILSADATDLEDIVELIKQRYCQLFPQWEIQMISIEKCADRVRQIDSMIAILEQLKKEQ